MDNIIEMKKLEKMNIPEVRQLFTACNDYFQLIDGVPVCGCRAETEFEYILAEEQGKTYGIYIEEKLIGVLFFILQYPEKMQATITLLLIQPDFRNQAVGNKAIIFLEEEARRNDLTSIILGVDEINQKAIAFWEKHGYKDTGQRKRYQHARRTGDIIYLEKVLS